MNRIALPLASLLLLDSCASGPELAGRPVVATLPQTSGTSASLRGVDAVDGDTCWASGSDGTFLRTVDGGRTWRAGRIRGAEELDFRDVQAFGDYEALVLSAGEPAEIWRTDDSGTSWQRVHRDTTPGIFFDAFAFSGDRGFAYSDPVDGAFVVLETQDRGRTWRRIPARHLPTPVEGEAGFAASGTCVAARGSNVWIGTGGAAARVLRSTDFGRSWEASATPMRAGAPSSGIFSLTFVDDERGAAVGGDYGSPGETAGSACFTVDGGRTWRLAKGSLPGYRSCVAQVGGPGPPLLVAIGKEGSSWSDDVGRTWRELDVPGYYAVDFAPDRPTGWAVGAEGRIARLELAR